MQRDSIWNYHKVSIELENCAGGLPVDPRMIDAWQQANWKKAAKLLPDDPQTPEEAAERTAELLAGVEPGERGWTTFPRTPEGRLCLEGRQIKAMLKEAANIMKTMVEIRGKHVPLRSKLAERVFVVERLVPFLPERKEPDETTERPIHVMTAQGPRDALKRTDVVHDVGLIFTLKVLNDHMFTQAVLEELIEYASENGLGADRSQGMGRFTYTME